MTEQDKTDLSREIGAPMLTVYGAGTILGAGIYVLIGKIAGEAGYWAPAAFLLAALVAGVNGLVYAELASRRPHAGGPSDYIDVAFGRRWMSILIGWMIVATGVVSAATITNGFAGYLGHFFDVPLWAPKAGMLIALGAIAAVGAKESAWFMALTTSLGVIGLAFVMYVGFIQSAGANVHGIDGYLEHLPSITEAGVAVGMLSAVFLSVYAFIGFEDIVHMAEEVRNPSRAIPMAIVVAIAIAAVLYTVISIAVLLLMSPSALASSEAPLVDAVKAGGYPGWPLAVLSFSIILNGALAQLIMGTRVIYSLGKRGGAPAILARVYQRTRTPLLATIAATAVAIVLALFFPLKSLAAATSLIMLLVFILSNAALIVLERRHPEAPFDIPVFVPWLGAVLSVALIIANFVFSGGGH